MPREDCISRKVYFLNQCSKRLHNYINIFGWSITTLMATKASNLRASFVDPIHQCKFYSANKSDNIKSISTKELKSLSWCKVNIKTALLPQIYQ